ncbi:MAG: protein-L-isoaspartate(D-aspartate) O-methyltransferase [Pseudomonadales bacterium]
MTSRRTRERLVARLREKGITHQGVLDAIGAIPRHIFVDEALAHRAYEDTALPIGFGQTISQPFVVALMTQLLLSVPRRRVLEVGTGCGYQTAVLATLVPRLFTIERLAELQQRAEERLRALGHRQVRCRCGDGYVGWPSEGPFDGILVTAAPPRVPEALLEQLDVGGRMVIPVGEGDIQELQVIDRTERGLRTETVEYVRFVPLVKGRR